MKFVRYQLTKIATGIVRKGHPWIFRTHLSSAADSIKVGQWLRLVDTDNRVIGYGIRDEQGAIGIRVVSNHDEPRAVYWQKKLRQAVAKRENLRRFTNGFRLLHGENDRVPGVVIDVYDGHAILQTYSPAIDSLGRFIACLAHQTFNFSSLVWRLPAKRKRIEQTSVRILKGSPPEACTIREGRLQFKVSILTGQKGGAFLDLRNLRKWLSLRNDLKGAHVLNLFSYTGTLGLACEVAGAREIWNVDIAMKALDFGRLHHQLGRATYKNIKADVFQWMRTLPSDEKFDCIIIDPPQMASDVTQVPQALKMYRKLYQFALEHLNRRARVIACCCTSRIDRSRFEGIVESVLGGQMKREANLKSEDDHPVGFPEGDYLKVLVYR